MRLDADVRELAEEVQRRRREAKKRVADQEIIGMRFMPVQDIREAATRNLQQVTGIAGEAAPSRFGGEALTALADAVNYALALITKGAGPDQEDEN